MYNLARKEFRATRKFREESMLNKRPREFEFEFELITGQAAITD